MKKSSMSITPAVLGLAVMLVCGSGWAQDAVTTDNAVVPAPTSVAAPAPAPAPAPKEDSYAAFLQGAGKVGPAQVALHNQAVLNLPPGYAFIPEDTARQIMHELGNRTDENFVGLILPEKEDTWFISVDFIPAGFIKDDDAKTWNADQLLSDIKESTEEANAEKGKDGMPPLEIVGWIERPHYDETSRRLVWSIEARDKGSTDNSKNLINYRTLMLGREGYISMVLVTDMGAVERHKPIAKQLLSNLNFTDGKKYTDFNASTDRVAEYGLAALVAGFAAKKLGLFAVLAAFIAKFAKVIIFVVIAFFAGIRKKFSRKKDENSGVATPPPPSS